MDRRLLKRLCLPGALAIMAFCAFVYQAVNGLSVTGLNEPVVWGAYVVNFTFCMGLGAGILIFLAGALARDDISGGFKFILSSSAFISLALSGLFIMLDLGRIDRFYYMLTHAQPGSPLFRDFVALQMLIGVSMLFCFMLLRQIALAAGPQSGAGTVERLIYRAVTVKKDIRLPGPAARTGGYLAISVILGVYFVTTEIFTGSKAHPQWNTPLVSLIFTVSALLSGLSIVMLLGSFRDERLSAGSGEAWPEAARRFLTLLLAADTAVTAVKYRMDTVNPLIRDFRTLFPGSAYVLLIAGTIVPLVLLIVCRRGNNIVYRAVPILVLTGVLFRRADLIIPAYVTRWLPFAPEARYMPTLPESLIVLGVYGAGAAAIIIIFHFAQKRLCWKGR